MCLRRDRIPTPPISKGETLEAPLQGFMGIFDFRSHEVHQGF